MDKSKATKIVEVLSKNYEDKPQLNFSSPYELLVAVMLSAQCTDERVNKVTKELFKEHGTPYSMLELTNEELEEYIRSCGLFKNKAKNVLATSKKLVERYNGEVPQDFNALVNLDGVGRKTANVVLSVAFKQPAIAVDTHVFRVANRIGLAKSANTLNTEKQLMAVLDKNDWSRAHHYLIYLGRRVCKAVKKPKCENCPINHLCEKKL